MTIHPLRLLRWLYLGRLILACGIFGAALLVWPRLLPWASLLVAMVMVLSLVVTLASFWYTHVLEKQPGKNFYYGQTIFDTVLVTAVVHLTGGGESDFAPLYIPVIAAGALLLPLPGGMLIGALASILYFADIIWLHGATPLPAVFIQIAIFAGVALVTGYLGDRLRQTGTALGAVELELRRLQLDTRELLETLDTGVMTLDGAGRLVYLNAAGEALLQIRAREWFERPFLEELDRRAPGLGTVVRRTASTRVPVRWHEARVETARGDRVFGGRTTILERKAADRNGADAGDASSPPWVTAVFQDITDSKRLEELNRRAERLGAVAALSASLAHEIKNPLASIRSAVEQLAGGRVEAEDRAVLERLVLRESDRLSRLLSEFIEFSRVEVRRHTEVDLAAVAAEAIGLVAQHPDIAGGARVEFLRPERRLVVDGDEDLLHRAIFNLVLNAAQHCGSDGRVRVRLDAVSELDLPVGVPLDSAVRVEVADDGPGIDPVDVGRIFDPFFTRRRGGTGLGLALVHRVAEAHQGFIFVDSAPGQGSRFALYLPERAERSVVP